MAEVERLWRQRHTHETHLVTYGTFGTASYDKRSQNWSFLRSQNGGGEHESTPIFRILSEPQLITQGHFQPRQPATRAVASNKRLYKHWKSLAPAQNVVEAILRDETGNSREHSDALIAFGSGVWLGVDGQDSGNLKIPITALVSGVGQDILRLVCVGRESFDYQSEGGISLPLNIPSLIGSIQASWQSSGRILQVVFSQPQRTGYAGTFLAVRQASRISIFEPLLRRHSYAQVSSDQSSLDHNLLLSFDRPVTGGQDYTDVSFNPNDQRQLAIVDVEGNWSTWHIHGQRSKNARKLYQAHLRASGKIFSWTHKRRPEGVGLYFDGWHRVLWLSSNGADIDRLLICNRQNAKLFGTDGELICWIDVRMDTRKVNSYILDLRPGSTTNTCLILTTSSLLIFDFSQEDWKDTGAVRGPLLLCAVQHFQQSLNLQLLGVPMNPESIISGIYNWKSSTIEFCKLQLMSRAKSTFVVTSNPRVLDLPASVLEKSISSLNLVPIETAPRTVGLMKLIIQYEDLSISTVVVESPNHELLHKVLKLPPSRGLKVKSERYVDNADDEDNPATFVVADMNVDCSSISDENAEIIQDVSRHVPPSQSFPAGKNTVEALEHVIHPSMEQIQKSDIPMALQAFKRRLENDAEIEGMHVVVDLFEKHRKVEDIDMDSATLERAMHIISSTVGDQIQLLTCHAASSRPLLDTYEQFFDSYVSSLDLSLPDQLRVSRERRIRDIALDMYLSSRTVWRLPKLGQSPLQEPSSPQKSDQIMFSDPLFQENPISQRHGMVSASQPAPRSIPSEPIATPSLLPGILSRLSFYTTIGNQPSTAASEDESVSKQVASILVHLPTSIDTDPSVYDWQSAELDAAALTGAASTVSDVSAMKAGRKAEKLAKARKKAEGIALPIMPRIHVSQKGPQAAAEAPPRTEIVVPIIMSEGNDIGSSQPTAIANQPGLTLTQPERGLFGSRVGVQPGNKSKKKKKRMAGF